MISIKLLCNFIEIALWYGCSPVNLLHIFRTPFLKNTSGWLLLIILEIIRNEMSSEQRKKNVNLESVASFWLTTLPIKEAGYVLIKQSFWDLVSVRCGWRLKRIPSPTGCGKTFNLQQALQCPKGGFENWCHNHI